MVTNRVSNEEKYYFTGEIMVEVLKQMAVIGLLVNLINLLFNIGLLGLIVSIIVLIILLIKKQVKILFPKIGIILFLILISISIIAKLSIKISFNNDNFEIINTRTNIHWKMDYNKSSYDYFTYKHKNYIFFEPQWNNVSDFIEIDRAVANIGNKSGVLIEIINTRQEENLFTIKDYPDDSLLITRGSLGCTIYCDENRYVEKSNYYENIDNYKCYASYNKGNKSGFWHDTRIIGNSTYWEYSLNRLELFDIDMIKEINSYSEGDYIEFPLGEMFDEIYIYGVSKDGVMKKKIADIIIFNDQAYKILFNKGVISNISYGENKVGTFIKLLNEENSEYIKKILSEIKIDTEKEGFDVFNK